MLSKRLRVRRREVSERVSVSVQERERRQQTSGFPAPHQRGRNNPWRGSLPPHTRAPPVFRSFFVSPTCEYQYDQFLICYYEEGLAMSLNLLLHSASKRMSARSRNTQRHDAYWGGGKRKRKEEGAGGTKGRKRGNP